MLNLALQGQSNKLQAREVTKQRQRNAESQMHETPAFRKETKRGNEFSKLSIRRVHLTCRQGCLLKAGEEVKLRPKVYETLKYLVEHPGRLIGKQELMQAVWPDAFVTDDSLVQCTLELRRALEDRNQQLLKTVPRRGYLFVAEVIQSATKVTVLCRHSLPCFAGRRYTPWQRRRQAP